MSLFLTLLPIYLFGNIHCASMCGPLVSLISKHKYRRLYFLGRLLSFSLAGLVAAEVGVLLQGLVLGPFVAFVFGVAVLATGGAMLFRVKGPLGKYLAKKTAPLSQKLATLVIKEGKWPTFLFGVCTILLPCGQTVVVFSALALSEHLAVGFFNGFMFALLTSPSLYFAMHFGKKVKERFPNIMGVLTLLTGMLLLCRGFAEMGYIPHAVLHSKLHLALF